MAESQFSKILVASHNDGKLKEIAELLQTLGIEAVSAKSYAIPEPEETAPDFAGNARLKSEHAAAHVKLPALADDSGLCIDALEGAPGIFSARLAKQHGSFDGAMRFLQKELTKRSSDDTRAHFVCALALSRHEAEQLMTEIFIGRVFGRLTFPPRGDRGFGYDPIFIPDGYDRTFAEMNPQDKHRISHRFHAFEQLCAFLQKPLDA